MTANVYQTNGFKSNGLKREKAKKLPLYLNGTFDMVELSMIDKTMDAKQAIVFRSKQ